MDTLYKLYLNVSSCRLTRRGGVVGSDGSLTCIGALEGNDNVKHLAKLDPCVGNLHGDYLNLVGHLFGREGNGIYLDTLCGDSLNGVHRLSVGLKSIGKQNYSCGLLLGEEGCRIVQSLGDIGG